MGSNMSYSKFSEEVIKSTENDEITEISIFKSGPGIFNILTENVAEKKADTIYINDGNYFIANTIGEKTTDKFLTHGSISYNTQSQFVSDESEKTHINGSCYECFSKNGFPISCDACIYVKTRVNNGEATPYEWSNT
jgi:hypothetical protein